MPTEDRIYHLEKTVGVLEQKVKSIEEITTQKLDEILKALNELKGDTGGNNIHIARLYTTVEYHKNSIERIEKSFAKHAEGNDKEFEKINKNISELKSYQSRLIGIYTGAIAAFQIVLFLISYFTGK